MSDFDILRHGMSYEKLHTLYKEHFSLGYINGEIQDKFALIGLICYLTHKAKQKQPGITHWQIISKVSEGMELPEDFLMSLSIICDDFAYGCKNFSTFGVDPKEVIVKIKSILNTYMPF